MLGPTAAGKSRLAEALADRLEAVLVSVDSMQVYRGMDIGTAKPPPAARGRYRMLDLVEPEVAFSVKAFQERGRAVLEELERAGRTAVIVGGSGLHFRALVDPFEPAPTDPAVRAELEARDAAELREMLLRVDPDAGRHVDLANPRRVVRALEIHRLTGRTPSERRSGAQWRAIRRYRPLWPFVGIGVDPGGRLRERVVARFDAMLAAGLLEEVRELAPRLGITAAQAVGYKELLPVVAGERSLAEGRRLAVAATTALAKRQRTFFRRDPRIRWLTWEDAPDAMVAQAGRVIEEVSGWSS